MSDVPLDTDFGRYASDWPGRELVPGPSHPPTERETNVSSRASWGRLPRDLAQSGKARQPIDKTLESKAGDDARPDKPLQEVADYPSWLPWGAVGAVCVCLVGIGVLIYALFTPGGPQTGILGGVIIIIGLGVFSALLRKGEEIRFADKRYESPG